MAKKIGIDTSVWIYALEEHPKFASLATEVLARIESGKLMACFSAIGMIELLTGPKLLGEKEIAVKYRQLLASFPNLQIVGLNENIVDIASSLRAKYGVRTPDAIHLATAIDFGATSFTTNDKTLVKVREIKVKVLGGNNHE